MVLFSGCVVVLMGSVGLAVEPPNHSGFDPNLVCVCVCVCLCVCVCVCVCVFVC